MSFLHIKRYKYIFSIATIFIFFIGLCFENVKTDPLALCTQSGSYTVSICAIDNEISDVSICTPEMIGLHTIACYDRISDRLTEHHLKEEIISNFIFVSLLNSNVIRFQTKYELVSFIKTSSKEPVINYIHNKDGKKRI